VRGESFEKKLAGLISAIARSRETADPKIVSSTKIRATDSLQGSRIGCARGFGISFG
jgi:hypothetical protein